MPHTRYHPCTSSTPYFTIIPLSALRRPLLPPHCNAGLASGVHHTAPTPTTSATPQLNMKQTLKLPLHPRQLPHQRRGLKLNSKERRQLGPMMRVPPAQRAPHEEMALPVPVPTCGVILCAEEGIHGYSYSIPHGGCLSYAFGGVSCEGFQRCFRSSLSP